MPARSHPADQAGLAAALGVELDAELLRRALTHRSYAYEHGGLPHNERLEFLGDSVLGIVVTETLYRAHPDLPEGKLAKLRASVVNMRALADVARGIGPDGLGAYLLLGRGEEATGGRDKSSILADTLEAVLGAIYLEHGLRRRRPGHPRPVRHAAATTSPTSGAGLDWKTSLQELTAERGLGVPDYVMTSDRARTTRRPSPPRRPSPARLFAPSHRPQQEGGRAGRRRDRLARAGRPRAAAPSRRPAARHRLSRCPNFPRSRPSATACSAGSPAAPIAVGRGHATRAPSAGTWPAPHDLAARLAGAPIEAVVAARQVPVAAAATTAADECLVAHLGMSGQLLVQPPDAPDEKHLHVRIRFTDGGRELRFVDQRTFGGVLLDALVPAAGPARASGVPGRIAHIARDPLDPHFDDAAVHRRGCAAATPRSSGRCSTRRCVSGVGNIYADESLWRARAARRAARPHAAPRRRSSELLGARARRARRGAAAPAARPSTRCTSTSTAQSGYFDRSLAVYGREGEPCPRCGTPIRRGGVHEPVELLLPALPAPAAPAPATAAG